jgi:hypothetical protein
MPPMWFEPAIPSSERPQTYALVRAATGIVRPKVIYKYFSSFIVLCSYRSDINPTLQ